MHLPKPSSPLNLIIKRLRRSFGFIFRTAMNDSSKMSFRLTSSLQWPDWSCKADSSFRRVDIFWTRFFLCTVVVCMLKSRSRWFSGSLLIEFLLFGGGGGGGCWTGWAFTLVGGLAVPFDVVLLFALVAGPLLGLLLLFIAVTLLFFSAFGVRPLTICFIRSTLATSRGSVNWVDRKEWFTKYCLPADVSRTSQQASRGPNSSVKSRSSSRISFGTLGSYLISGEFRNVSRLLKK